MKLRHTPLMPANAGIQGREARKNWVPAFAGTSGRECYFNSPQSVARSSRVTRRLT
jgi:hypothetical protein